MRSGWGRVRTSAHETYVNAVTGEVRHFRALGPRLPPVAAALLNATEPRWVGGHDERTDLPTGVMWASTADYALTLVRERAWPQVMRTMLEKEIR